MNIVAIGEVLWDVFPSSERLGGAPFNFSAHAARLGHHVAFVSGVGTDDRGNRVLAEMAHLGVPSRYVKRVFDSPTGAVTVALSAEGEPAYTIHRPAAYDFPALDETDLGELRALRPQWIYYGTLAQTSPVVRAATQAAIHALPEAGRFYDVNLRPGSDDPDLVLNLLAGASFVKLNEHERMRLSAWFEMPATEGIEAFCARFCSRFHLEGLCVTLGEAGCAILFHNEFAYCPGCEVTVKDAVGAGDAFSAAFLHGVCSEWNPAQIGDFANRVGALVASRAGAIPNWDIPEALALPYNRKYD